jgi:CRP-like cAMP-binding protein
VVESITEVLARVELFADLDDGERREACALFRPLSFARGTTIFRQGASGDGLYLIETGKVELTIRMPGEATSVLAHLGPGDVLGEMALADPLLGRSATALVVDDAATHFLASDAFAGLCAHLHPVGFKLLTRFGRILRDRLRARHRDLGTRVRLRRASLPPLGAPAAPRESAAALSSRDVGFARVLPCFRRLTDRELADLVPRLRRREVARGTPIYAEGEAASACYFVLRGAVELALPDRGAGGRIALLGPGRAFGHLDVLDDQPRAFGAVAREEAIVLELPRADLEELLARREPSGFKLLAAFNEEIVAALHRTGTLQVQAAVLCPG